jgi:hypothetical protein
MKNDTSTNCNIWNSVLFFLKFINYSVNSIVFYFIKSLSTTHCTFSVAMEVCRYFLSFCPMKTCQDYKETHEDRKLNFVSIMHKQFFLASYPGAKKTFKASPIPINLIIYLWLESCLTSHIHWAAKAHNTAHTKLIKWAPGTEGNQQFWPNSTHASSDKSLASERALTNCNPPPPASVCFWAECCSSLAHIIPQQERCVIFCLCKRQPIKIVHWTGVLASNLIMRPQQDICILFENRPEALTHAHCYLIKQHHEQTQRLTSRK